MLPKTNRLTLSDKKYKELRKNGQTTQTKELFIAAILKKNKKPTKFAIVVPKKLDKRSVKRNKTRRLISAAIYKRRREIKKGREAIIMAKKIFNNKLQDVQPIADDALKRAGLI